MTPRRDGIIVVFEHRKYVLSGKRRFEMSDDDRAIFFAGTPVVFNREGQNALHVERRTRTNRARRIQDDYADIKQYDEPNVVPRPIKTIEEQDEKQM